MECHVKKRKANVILKELATEGSPGLRRRDFGGFFTSFVPHSIQNDVEKW